jgi:hypothetical protein
MGRYGGTLAAGDDERSEPDESLVWEEVLAWLGQRVGKLVTVSLYTNEGDSKAFVFGAQGRLRPFSGVVLDGDETRPRRGDVDGVYDIGDDADLDLISAGILHAEAEDHNWGIGGMRGELRLEISEGVWIEVEDSLAPDEDEDLVFEQLRMLIVLRDQGILTPEEFETKKAQIVAVFYSGPDRT